jgi:hypothetical protein
MREIKYTYSYVENHMNNFEFYTKEQCPYNFPRKVHNKECILCEHFISKHKSKNIILCNRDENYNIAYSFLLIEKTKFKDMKFYEKLRILNKEILEETLKSFGKTLKQI